MTRRRRRVRALIAIALGLAAGGGGSGLAQAAPAASTGASITSLRCNITATGTYRLGPNVTAAAISVAIYQVNAGDLLARPLVQDGRAVSARSGYLTTRVRIRRTASTTRYYASTVLNYRVGRGPVRRSTAVSRSISTRCP